MSEKRLGQVLGLAHVVDDPADRPERRHRHEIRLHETAGGLFRIFQVALERGAVAGRDLRQDLLLVRLLEVLDEIGGVVGLELARRRWASMSLGSAARELVAHRLVELGQHLRIEGRPQRLDQLDALRRAPAAR